VLYGAQNTVMFTCEELEKAFSIPEMKDQQKRH